MKRSKVEFKKRVKKARPSLGESTLTVYTNNLARVAKLAEKEAIPDTSGWLDDEALRKKVGKLDIKVRRHLLTAVVVALGAYGKERTGAWGKMLAEASEQYSKIRDKREKSEVEVSKWPKGGHKAIKKILSALKPKADRVLSKTEPTKSDLFALQKYLIFLLYDANPWRNDPATFQVGQNDNGNRIFRKKGSRNWTVLMRQHKTSKSLGTVEIVLSTAISRKLSKVIPFLMKNRKGDKLLYTSKGQPMSRSALSKLLLRTTDSILGKKFGSRQLRVMFASSQEAVEVREKAEEQAKRMLHSQKMHKTYSKR